MSRISERPTTALWHPFAHMPSIAGREVVLVRGEGAWVEDEDGKRYLDASAGLWYCNIGHGRAELAEVAAAQMRELASYQLFDVMANRPALDLAERVRDLSPLGDRAAVFFTSGGSDSIDTAAKMARRYWTVGGEPDRNIIIDREGAYHGVNGFGTSLSGLEANAAGWGRSSRRSCRCPATTSRRSSASCRSTPAGRRLHRRAGPGRRRRPPAAARLLAGRAGPLPRPRRADHRRRGHHRLRPRGPLVRQRALRDRARPDHLRQGPQLRLLADRGRDRRRSRRSTGCGPPTPAPSATATPTPGTPPPAPWRSPASRSSSARAWSNGSPTWSRRWPRSSARSPPAP